MDSDVQQIKDRLNIADIVGQYVKLRRAGRTYMGLCPFHKERTPSFHVSPERGTYKCFGCGEGGDIFSFLQKMDGTDFPTVLKQMAEKAGVKLTPRSGAHTATPEQKEHDERLHDVCEAAVAFFEQKLKERKDVQEYLKTRGATEETVSAWRLGYAPAEWEALCRHLVSTGFSKEDIVDAGFALKSERKPGEIFDRFRGRIMFPIFDMAGKPIAVSGRFFEEIKIEASNVEEMEEKLIKEHLGQIKVEGLTAEQEERITKELLTILSTEKGEGEKVADFERRVKEEVNKVLRV